MKDLRRLVVTLVIVFTSGSDTSSPEGVAEAAVSAANDQDSAAIALLLSMSFSTSVSSSRARKRVFKLL